MEVGRSGRNVHFDVWEAGRHARRARPRLPGCGRRRGDRRPGGGVVPARAGRRPGRGDGAGVGAPGRRQARAGRGRRAHRGRGRGGDPGPAPGGGRARESRRPGPGPRPPRDEFGRRVDPRARPAAARRAGHGRPDRPALARRGESGVGARRRPGGARPRHPREAAGRGRLAGPLRGRTVRAGGRRPPRRPAGRRRLRGAREPPLADRNRPAARRGDPRGDVADGGRAARPGSGGGDEDPRVRRPASAASGGCRGCWPRPAGRSSARG